MTWTDFLPALAPGLQLTGTILLAVDVWLILQPGPKGPHGGEAAQALKEHRQRELTKWQRRIAWVGLGLILIGLSLDISLSLPS